MEWATGNIELMEICREVYAQGKNANYKNLNNEQYGRNLKLEDISEDNAYDASKQKKYLEIYNDIMNISGTHWLATTGRVELSSTQYDNCRYYNNSGIISYKKLWTYTGRDNPPAYEQECGLRPVVVLKQDVKIKINENGEANLITEE